MFGKDRNQMRRFYVEAWCKYRNGDFLEPLQSLIAEVIVLHPEYHNLLEQEDAALSHEYAPEQGETNPFLHMGMHIAIREQVATDRPPGIAQAYRYMLGKIQDVHEVEHRILECLGQALWDAQRNGVAPDEQAYLECVQLIR